MSARRSRGDGGLHWDERRQRWIASVTTGYTPDGKRIVRRASGKTKTAAKEKLREIVRTVEDGHAVAEHGYTVEHAVRDWLTYGLTGRAPATIETRRILAEQHVIPALGARKLRELSAEDVDRWLARKARTLSTRTLQDIRSILLRSVTRAQARDKVRRNVVLLCSTPTGQRGRPSKALTYAQAQALLELDVTTTYGAYVVVGLLTGARTEELRALIWDDVDLLGQPDTDLPVPPHMKVWRSVRLDGDTKTRKSRRTIALPGRAVEVLRSQRERQLRHRSRAGAEWQEHGLVFASETGTPLDAANVRRGFRTVLKAAGLDAGEWTPRELRHSFVSLLSDSGMTIDQIARLVGHTGGSTVTELIYRKQIRPVIDDGATAMDGLFPRAEP
ncbi:site-specific integrase [Pseudonocardia sp. C8]|uniref:site-specific integrase n=1 Tax=Pseudonocardia sp. C8 TaxID=2762759 RepID=UPI001642B9C2|nr:site-specific integrase [Pseudonocardia sp. C8]MBC3194149.1 site-specific integrase [Pseudonocardia sp. C8]